MKVRTDIKFGWVRHLDMNLRFRIGLGADDSLWVPADFLGLKTSALEQLRQKYGAVVLMDIDDGRIYVDSSAVVLNCANTFVREVLELKIGSLKNQLKQRIKAHESAGNSQNN